MSQKEKDVKEEKKKVETSALSDCDRLAEFCRRGNKSGATELISADKKLLNTTGQLGNTALHWAAMCGHDSVIELLCSEGAQVNLQNKIGDTALHIAASKGYLGAVRTLLKFKSDKSITNNDKKTPDAVAKGVQVRQELSELNETEIGDLVTLAKEDEGNN
eukprot:TRINITY_DN10256_c0_g1_i1.p1 TRINITY_DN10256_c0_g1~~TRINITY_DN10256_c0_g1_i1.p1  ORF type:complete len:161 (+),score=19.64 TRINITY_DN10256_c0_g1_i1:140-622(+)